MKRAVLVNNLTGEKIEVHATTEHPDSHYGREVWVDEQNVAYMEVDSRIPNPFYHVENIKE